MMTMRERIYRVATLLLVASSAGAATKVASTVALQVTTPLTVAYGEMIDGLAQVTASEGTVVTGSVTFYDGTRSFCVLTLENGASCPEGSGTGFAAGPHVFTAVYSGDATHAGATSNAVAVTVTEDTTTTAVASSANPMAVGGSVVYTASVAGAHAKAAGTVTFLDGSKSMGEAALDSNGTAALSVLMLTAGDHAITAVYAGDGNSAGSASAVLHETVQGVLAATTTTLSTSADTVAAGHNVTLTAKVAASGVTPGGVVTFSDGKTTLGSARVSAGVAVLSTSALSVGSHSIGAVYAGDAWTAASVSPVMSVTITQPSTPAGPAGLTLGANEVTVAAGDWVNLPVAISGTTGQAKVVSLSCSGLPEEASCTFNASGSTTMLKIATSAPRDCGSSVPYGDAPAKGALLLALLLVPRRKTVRLLGVLCAVLAMGSMTGCGTGACTDLGSRPGTYMVTVSGSMSGTVVSQKVKLVVTP